MHAPRIQHQTTLAGPPVSKGVLKVVATDDTRPMMEKANEMVARFENSRLNEPVKNQKCISECRPIFAGFFSNFDPIASERGHTLVTQLGESCIIVEDSDNALVDYGRCRLALLHYQ